MKRKVTITLAEKILKNVDSIIDRVYIRNRSQAVEYLIERTLGKNKTAVILVSGPSEDLRMGKYEFRSTAQIANTSVIEQTIFNLRKIGFKSIFIVGEKPVLTSIFKKVSDGKHYGVQISFFEDPNPPGTAESLRLIKGDLKNTFLVISGDILFDSADIKRLWQHHLKNSGIATAMMIDSSLLEGGIKIPIKTSLMRVEGEVIVTAFSKLASKLKENHESSFIFSSIFVAEPEIFAYSGNWIENDILPALAEKRLLYSYVGRWKEAHVHSKEDIKIAAKFIANSSNA